MTKAVWGAALRLAGTAAVLLASTSCGDVSTQGTSSSILIINSIEAASGADPSEFGGTLESDVITLVKSSPTVFADPARVEFRLGLKDPGPSGTPITPSQNNFVTVDRYRVRFMRTDGRNVEGVDVPYGFDGAFTATVATTVSVGFTLVRVQAKEEAPLRALGANGGVVSTIAEVTFYGRDQTGRAVSATGMISVNFANYGDPDSGGD